MTRAASSPLIQVRQSGGMSGPSCDVGGAPISQDLGPAGKAIARRHFPPRGRRQAARTRAAALERILKALAPHHGAAITVTVTARRGAPRRRGIRSTFSHPDVLFVLRRAFAEAAAAAAAYGTPPRPAALPQPKRLAASA